MAVSSALATAMLGGLPGTFYVQVHSGDPGALGTANTIVGPARGTVTLSAASGGQRVASGIVDCPGVPQGASVSWVSYWDAAVGGNFLFPESLGVTVTFAYAGTLRFTSQVFTISTASAGSQTATSIVGDSSAASDSNVTRHIIVVTDTSSATDVGGAFYGTLDSSTSTDAVVIALTVVVADTSSAADTAIGNAGAVSSNIDTSSASDSNAVTQAFLSANTDTTSGSDSNTASSVDTTAPSVTAFTVGTPSGSSVPVSSFTGSDNIAVTGFLVTESSTPPSSGAAGWVGTAPTTYTAVGTGSVTLYPWVKDAAGNVSSVFGSPRTVTISSGGTVLGFEDGTAQGMTLSGFAVSNVNPITGSYSLRKAGFDTSGGSFTAGSGSKSVTVTNGATVSIKCKATIDNLGLGELAQFGLTVDGVTRGSSLTITGGDSTTHTLSWVSTLATGAHTVGFVVYYTGANDTDGPVLSNYDLRVDDITFS